MSDWIQTYTGKKFYPINPKIEDIDIEDIAHALSMICRFTGHCDRFYSVAEHSVYVSRNVPKELALRGLLHDASEAYLSDVARPLKRSPQFAQYREIEHNLQSLIYKKFGIVGPDSQEIKSVDTRVLFTEHRDLMAIKSDLAWSSEVTPYPFKVQGLLPPAAKELFLHEFGYLNLPDIMKDDRNG